MSSRPLEEIRKYKNLGDGDWRDTMNKVSLYEESTGFYLMFVHDRVS